MFLVVLLPAFFGSANAQPTGRILNSIAFSADTGYTDLSTKLIWGTNSQPVSAFKSETKTDRWGVEKSGLTLSDSGFKYLSWQTPRSLKTCNSIDISFPPVNRRADSLVIEVDVFWDTLTNSGEAGRINLILLHQYPNGGPAFGMTDSLNALPMPFGRPAYHFRVVPRITSIRGYRGFYSYGGNNDSLGKLYMQTNAQGQPVWWLPGAVPVSGPGFSEATAYPRTPFIPFSADQIPERKTWITLTWSLGREIHWVFSRRANHPPDSNRLAYSQFFPINGPDTRARLSAWYGIPVDTLPYLYRDFPVVEALRLYGFGLIKTWWGGVRIQAFNVGPTTSLPGIGTRNRDLRIQQSDHHVSFESGWGKDFALFTISGQKMGDFEHQDKHWQIRRPAGSGIYLIRGKDLAGLPVVYRLPVSH